MAITNERHAHAKEGNDQRCAARIFTTDPYRQTLVGLFLTKTHKPTVFSNVKIFPTTTEIKNEQTFECPIPRSADIVIVALKWELCKKDEVLYPMEMRGMEIIWSWKFRSLM